MRRDPAPVGCDEDLGHVGGYVGWRAQGLDEPRRPGLEEVGRDGEAVDGIGVDGHGDDQADEGAGTPAAGPAAGGTPCSVPTSRPSAARRR